MAIAALGTTAIGLAARGETPAAFDGRCILARLGATPDFHHGLPAQAPPAKPTPESIARAEQVLAEARKALGGDKLTAVKTLVATGRTRRIRGNNLVPIEFEILLELPDKYLRVDEFPAEDTDPTSSGFNGDALIQSPPLPTGPPAGRSIPPGAAPGATPTTTPGAAPPGSPVSGPPAARPAPSGPPAAGPPAVLPAPSAPPPVVRPERHLLAHPAGGRLGRPVR